MRLNDKHICDCCGASDPVQSPWAEELCPTCMTKYALTYAAGDHMKTLLRQALEAWERTWAAHPHVIQHMFDEANVTIGSLAEEIAEERTAEPEHANAAD